MRIGRGEERTFESTGWLKVMFLEVIIRTPAAKIYRNQLNKDQTQILIYNFQVYYKY